jgi:hypothetical protein
MLPTMFDALAEGTDPDRMKGALYVLWGKGTAAYAFAGEGVCLLPYGHRSDAKNRPQLPRPVSHLATGMPASGEGVYRSFEFRRVR